MTIAGAYLSHEGLVLGADSTVTVTGNPKHFFNYDQKILEIGEQSTLAMLQWGLGDLRNNSFRTLIAQLGDALDKTPATSVEDVARRWADRFWEAYLASFADERRRCESLLNRSEFGPDEEAEVIEIANPLVAGMCIGGYCPPDRTACAYEMGFSILDAQAPSPLPIPHYVPKFWGCPSYTERLIWGVDQGFLERIATSSQWTGTPEALIELLRPSIRWRPHPLPIREAIDLIHSSIYATIKGYKFSADEQVCGGPIEIALISTDRRFRWIRHKSMKIAAI